MHLDDVAAERNSPAQSCAGLLLLQVLVAVYFIIMLEHEALHNRGEFHVEIKEVHDKGDGEEAEAGHAELYQRLAKLFPEHFISSLPRFLIMENFEGRIYRLLTHNGTHIGVDLVTDTLT